MAIIGARAYEQSLIDALAISDPQLNTALGTPVRKIITAVAQELAAYNVDVNVSTTLYSIESVSGTELDYLVGQFGFTRHEARAARGSITVNRDNGDSIYQFEYGMYVYKPATSISPSIAFQTVAYQEMSEGVLSCNIGIVAVEAGSIGNVPADTITYMGSTDSYMYVTNPNPTTGGRDAETDEQLRQRFLTTVFRNVAGTKDQLVGLALAHAQVRRAVLIGQESRYSEIVQAVQLLGDSAVTASPSEDKWNMDVDYCLDVEHRYWVRFVDTQELLSRGDFEVSNDGRVVTFHDRDGSDIIGPVATGTSYALSHKQITSLEVVDGETGAPIPIYDYPPITTDVDGSKNYIKREEGIIVVGNDVEPNRTWSVTYTYHYIGDGDFVTIEFDYFSKHNRGGMKTVDLFVDCLAPKNVTDIQYIDFSKEITAENAGSWVRLDGQNPTVGHLYVPLSYQPLYASSGHINAGTSLVLYEDTHYKVLYDATRTAGSARGMDAIELLGVVEGTGSEQRFHFSTVDPAQTVGGILLKDDTPLAIPYLQDYPVDDVQRLIDSQRIVTMDVQVHEAVHRYFVIYLTLMFTTFPKDSIIEGVKNNIMSWAGDLSYGHVVQFSDIETVAANTSGVDNVRVSIRSDAGTKLSTYFDINGHAPGAYGIIEVHRDGFTVLHQYTNDFRLAENELFEVQDIITYAKSQQRWGS